jgi:hypothetical protein
LRDGEPSHGQLLHNPLSLTTFTVQPLGSTSLFYFPFILFWSLEMIEQKKKLRLNDLQVDSFVTSSINAN